MNPQEAASVHSTEESEAGDRLKDSLCSRGYPLIYVARETMAILSSDSSRTLLTAYYAVPPGGATFILKRGKLHGLQIGSVTTHSFRTDKVDVEINGGKFRFKETFESLAGLGQLTWRHESDSLLLEDAGKALVARFVPNAGQKKGTKMRLEGRIEVRRQGLSSEQFEEVVITCLAELERQWKKPLLDGPVLESIAVGNAYDGGGCCVM